MYTDSSFRHVVVHYIQHYPIQSQFMEIVRLRNQNDSLVALLKIM